jgi:hypothetical protein
VEDVYAAILRHPFVTGLTDGSLPREAFRHYIVQDATTCAVTPARWRSAGPGRRSRATP